MDAVATFTEHADHLLCEISGRYSRSDSFRIVDELLSECRARKQTCALVDLRQVRDDIPTIDRYALGVYCAEKLGNVIRLAVVCRAECINWFFESVALNRGLATRVSDDVLGSQRWLRSAA